MDQYIDKETKQFLLILAGMTIFLMFIYPRLSNGTLINLNLSNGLNALNKSNTSQNTTEKPTIDIKKDYSAIVKTNKGDFTIDLFEESAPLNVSNLVKNASSYNDAKVTDQTKDFLFKVDVSKDPSKKLKDEINADYLGLDEKKVKDSAFLKDQYDKDNKETKAFAPENLDKYEDQNLKEFYKRELNYTYSTTLTTPKAKKYMVYLANKKANDNGLDFFVVMSNTAPQIDGRYTPIGQVTKGLDVLDKINESNDTVINSLKVEIADKKNE